MSEVPGVEAPADRRPLEHRARHRRASRRACRRGGAARGSGRARRTARRARRACRTRWSHCAGDRGKRAAHAASTTTAETNIARPGRSEQLRSPAGCVEGDSPLRRRRAARAARSRRRARDRGDRAPRAASAASVGRKPGAPSSVAEMPSDGHLGEHAVGRQHDTPSRHLADAPRDRAGANPRRMRHALQHVLGGTTRFGALHGGHSTPVPSVLSRIGPDFVGALYCPYCGAVVH